MSLAAKHPDQVRAPADKGMSQRATSATNCQPILLTVGACSAAKVELQHGANLIGPDN
jgi:hypothetical protein